MYSSHGTLLHFSLQNSRLNVYCILMINDVEEYKCQNGMYTPWIPLDIGHFYLWMGAATRAHPSFGMTTTKTSKGLFSRDMHHLRCVPQRDIFIFFFYFFF